MELHNDRLPFCVFCPALPTKKIYEVYVGGLNPNTTVNDLNVFFRDCMPERVSTIKKKDLNKSAYAFVSFKSLENYEEALKLNRKMLIDRRIFVKPANSAGGKSVTQLPSVSRTLEKPDDYVIVYQPPFLCLITNLPLNYSATQITNILVDCKVDRMHLDSLDKRMALVEFNDAESLKAAVSKEKLMVKKNTINITYTSLDDEKVKEALNFPSICPANTSLSDEMVFDFAFLKDPSTISYVKGHGRIVFVVRGPMGSRREGLVAALSSCYSMATVLCPSQFFDEPFLQEVTVNFKNERILVKQSHHWCLYKLKTLMEANVGCLILSTTSCIEWQMDFYTNQILKQGYTVIMAETPRKIEAQEVKKRYFKEEDQHFQQYVPWYMGWFLNPADANYLVKIALETFAELTTEDWKDLGLPAVDVDLSGTYKLEPYIFAMCRYCFDSKSAAGTRYYTSQQVTNNLGKVTTLSVAYFLVDSHHIYALAELSPELAKLFQHLQSTKTDEADQIKEARHLSCSVKSPVTASSLFTVVTKQLPPVDHKSGLLTPMILASSAKASFPSVRDVCKSLDFLKSCSCQLLHSGLKGDFLRIERPEQQESCLLISLSSVYQMKAIYTGLY